jgi:hypothetical protein
MSVDVMLSHGEDANEDANKPRVELRQGAQRLVREDEYAEGVRKNFNEHVEKHSKLDALSRCKALNTFLSDNV